MNGGWQRLEGLETRTALELAAPWGWSQTGVYLHWKWHGGLWNEFDSEDAPQRALNRGTRSTAHLLGATRQNGTGLQVGSKRTGMGWRLKVLDVQVKVNDQKLTEPTPSVAWP